MSPQDKKVQEDRKIQGQQAEGTASAHGAPNLPQELVPVPTSQDGQPDSLKNSGKAGRRTQPINQNLPQAQGARQPDRGGKQK
jgi:hypothetical protein